MNEGMVEIMGSLGRRMVEMMGTIERRMVEMVSGVERGELVLGLMAIMLTTIMIRKAKTPPGCLCPHPATCLPMTERGGGKNIGFLALCCAILH